MENIVVMFEDENSGVALKKELVGKGYCVISVCVKDDDIALSVLARHNGAVKVVVLDLNMSNICRLEFLKKMRQRGYRYPVIVITESGDKSYPLSELDVYDIIEKPFNTSVLLGMILDCQKTYSDLRCEVGNTVKMLRKLVKM